MKKILYIILLVIINNASIYAQTSIVAEKEILNTIEVGTGENQLYLSIDEESIIIPAGPYIDPYGNLFFSNKKRTLIYSDGKFSFSNDIDLKYALQGTFAGQCLNGYVINHDSIGVYKYIFDKLNKIDIKNLIKMDIERYPGYNNYSEYIPFKNGIIMDFHDKKVPYDIKIIEIDEYGNARLLDDDDQIIWLKNNKLELKSDGNLYKNSFLFSGLRKNTHRTVARLRSGHVVHASDRLNKHYQSKFYICRPDGSIEITLEMPWSYNGFLEPGKCYYNWCFGNYGELYVLTLPTFDMTKDGSLSFDEGEAELAVVRNYLKYFGVLTDDRIRLRSEPTTSSESLGTYPINTGFMILEKGTKQETIGGDTGVWFKVRLLDGKEGWFFGAYVRDLYDGPGTPLPWPNVADWN